jgi:hypothetical protein
MDVLVRIKRLVVRGAVRFTEKARSELEAILSAASISKTIRSRSRVRSGPRETLYAIVGVSFLGVPIYTKGVLRR